MNNKITLSIIIVSYNTSAMTLECIRSVYRETKKINYEVIVLDNASTDGSAEAIASEFGDKLKLINLTDNLGFAAGNNRAVKISKGENLLLLNPDTIVLDNAIEELIKFSKEMPYAKIWGGKTLFKDRTLNPASCWMRQTLWSLLCQAVGFNSLFRESSLFNTEAMGGWNREGIRQVDIVSGCFLLIGRDLWNTLGGFQESFFMYGEEADLCLRAKQFGAKPKVTSAATIIHYGGASEKVRADMMVRLLKAKYFLIQLHFSKRTSWLGLRLLYLWPLSRYIAHSILSIFGRSSSYEPRKVWMDIFKRRNEWSIKINVSKNQGGSV